MNFCHTHFSWNMNKCSYICPMIRNNTTLFIVLLIAFSLRAGFALLDNHPIASDEVDYVELATHIVQGAGYSSPDGTPTAYRPPGYPFFLAGLFTLSATPLFIKLVQCLIGCGSCFLIFLIGKKIFSEKVGLIAMTVWSLFPTSIMMTSELLSETVFTFLFLLLLCYTVYRDTAAPFIVGVLSGLLILLKPQVVLLFLGVLLYNVLRRNRLWIRSVPLIAAGIIVITVPWTIRNVVTMNSIGISTNGGVNFWIGNNPEANGSYKIPSADTLSSVRDEGKRNSLGYFLGTRFIINNPGQFFTLSVVKTAYLFSSQNYILTLLSRGEDPPQQYRDRVRTLPIWIVLLVNIPYLFILFLGVRGLIAGQRKYESAGLPIHYLVATWIIIHVFFFGAARFNYPLLPLFVLTGSAFVVHGTQTAVHPLWKRSLSIGIALLALLPTIVEITMTYGYK